MAHSSAFLSLVLSPCRGSISGFLDSFQSGGAFSGQRALTIERSVMSGCGQGHEPAKNLRRKLWIKFLGLTPGRSGNTSERRWDWSTQDH